MHLWWEPSLILLFYGGLHYNQPQWSEVRALSSEKSPNKSNNIFVLTNNNTSWKIIVIITLFSIKKDKNKTIITLFLFYISLLFAIRSWHALLLVSFCFLFVNFDWLLNGRQVSWFTMFFLILKSLIIFIFWFADKPFALELALLLVKL